MDSRTSLGTYLGEPVDIQGRKVQYFTFLLDKKISQITRWNLRPISKSGKLILINSVLIDSIIHILSVFQIPTTITNKLDSMLARFFWAIQGSKGIHWRMREIIQLPKGVGGLVIRSVNVFNKALLMKKVRNTT